MTAGPSTAFHAMAAASALVAIPGDPGNAERLWQVSEDLTGVRFKIGREA